jgi:dimethylargininase
LTGLPDAYSSEMLKAITRGVSDRFSDDCQLTFFKRMEIDLDLARRQHKEYETALQSLGVAVTHLPSDPELADCVFVEDTAVVLDEIAIITRPGAETRREEGAAVEKALKGHRRLARIQAPGTLDGGDVLVLCKNIYVGISGRSNASGRSQLREIVEPFSYLVIEVQLAGCLHLKSAVTKASGDTLLINPRRVDPENFGGWRFLAVDPDEPEAANVLWLPEGTIYPSHFPKTEAILREAGIPLVTVDASEAAKAEGAVTCCSLIFSGSP